MRWLDGITDSMDMSRPLGTPLGLAQRKRASPRGEAGTERKSYVQFRKNCQQSELTEKKVVSSDGFLNTGDVQTERITIGKGSCVSSWWDN